MGMGNQIASSGTGAPAGKGGTSGVGGMPPGGLTGANPFNGPSPATSFNSTSASDVLGQPSMGRPNALSRQEMGGGGGLRASPAMDYFAQNPDVAKAFGENSYGMNQEDFAKTHFTKFGEAEGRTFGAPQGQQPSFGSPNPYANTTGVAPAWDKANVMPPMGGGKGGKSGAGASGGGKGQSNYTPLPPIAQYQPPVTAPANNFQDVPNPAAGPNTSTAGY